MIRTFIRGSYNHHTFSPHEYHHRSHLTDHGRHYNGASASSITIIRITIDCHSVDNCVWLIVAAQLAQSQMGPFWSCVQVEFSGIVPWVGTSSLSWSIATLLTINGAVTNSFFPSDQQRPRLVIPATAEFTSMVSGHGNTRSYLYRFRITEDETCTCKVGRTPACVKTCNSQDTMSATWRKERSTVGTNEIMKTAAHRSESWCWR
jgi:hypothetical protein